MSKGLLPYLKIARPDHWFKNIFMLPGTGLALILAGGAPEGLVLQFLAGVAATCLLASANYVINEYLDAEFDRHHPIKKHRPSVLGKVKGHWVIVEYVLLIVVGLSLGAWLGKLFFICGVFFIFMGFLYNVRPFRLKERPIVDVLSESINNPIRLVLGWAIVEKVLIPPSSVLLAYWFGGAFLMAIKRYSEYRTIDDPEVAALYRKSFSLYSADLLLLSGFFYALNSALFLGVFLIKYRVEFLIVFPFIALLFTWYLWFGLRQDGVAEHPEQMYRKPRFLLFTGAVGLLLVILFVVDIPVLAQLMEKSFLKVPGN